MALDLEKRRISHRRWARANRAKELARKRRWLDKNPGCHLRYKDSIEAWKKANPGASKATISRYYARRTQRVPAWADHELIKAFYRDCPEGYHVDHIVPLNGREVCGLHVHYNLQYLTPSENAKKANKLLLDSLPEVAAK